jgi:hypothetical protein
MNTEVCQSSTPLRGATNSICMDAHRSAQELRMTDLPTSLDLRGHSSSTIEVPPCLFNPESPSPHAIGRSYSCSYGPASCIPAAYIDAGSQCVNNLPMGQRCFEQRKCGDTSPNRQTEPRPDDRSTMQMKCFPQLGSSVDLRHDQQAWHVRALEARCAWLQADNKDKSRELQELKVHAMEKTAMYEDQLFHLRRHIHKSEIGPEWLNLVAPAESRRESIHERNLLGKRKHPETSDDDVATGTHRCKRICYG